MDRPLVGREPEQERIGSALRGLLEGRPGLLFACGEAGIGKSSLARWAAEEAQRLQIDTHWGICWEAGGAPAFWPWAQLLRSILLSAPNRQALEAIIEHSPRLLSLMPEYAATGEQAADLQPEFARFQLLETVGQLLQVASRGPHLLLILEDLHAADADSLQLLEFIASRTPRLPVVLLATFRDADARLAGKADPLWQAARNGEVMHLAGLDEAAVGRLLAGGSGDRQPSVRALLERTHGNPLFLTELIQCHTNDLDEALPDSVSQVITRQLNTLPADSIALLEAASVVGRSFTLEDLAALVALPEQLVDDNLDPACDLRLIESSETGRCRFAHILYRDAIYQGLEPGRRRQLHLAYSDYLGQLTERGREERWQELALHLERVRAAQREASIHAWRMAGRHAKRVSALSDAASCLRRALELFSSGRRTSPQDRCDLLLELAAACMASGDVSGAHESCREAFRIARALGDNRRMAEAALTFGGVYVAARIDEELIGLLEETMEALPEDAVAERAQVGARLAAARQPAADWQVPVAQARESIRLARQCDDERVLFTTLRSAVSALIDYVPCAETYALDREYVDLAARFDQPVESFRGYSRLLIDCCGLGDLRGFDRALEACATVAERLAVPHYGWRVSSARAMRDTFQGRFAQARLELERARELARRCDDPASAIPLPLQALELAFRDPAATSEEFDEAVAEVDAVLERFPWANLFTRPRLDYCQLEQGSEIRHGLSLSADQVEEMLFSCDEFVIADIGRLAMARDDRPLSERVYSALLESEDACSHFGLMGMVWGAPVALEQARLAAYLGQEDAARQHLEVAREVATRMHAEPALRDIADVASSLSDSPATQPGDRVPLELVREGDLWRLHYATGSALLKDSRGLQLLAQLLQRPDEEIHVLELVGGARQDSGDLAALDPRAKAEYQARLEDLREELDEARELGDSGRAESARSEMDFITRELTGAFGLGGRPRASGSDAERARVNVQRRLKDAIKRIEEQLPDAGRYLQGTIDTGTYCRYRPL